MAAKLYREHDAEAAMLAYRTGLSAAICKAWLEATTVNSANAPKAAFDSDHNSIIATRYKIEAYALGSVGIQDSHSSLAVIQALDGPIRFD
jgi:hypothetical protein